VIHSAPSSIFTEISVFGTESFGRKPVNVTPFHMRTRSAISLNFSLGCFPTPTRRKKSIFLVHFAGVLKKRFWQSVWLPTPLEDVPRRFLDYGNMRRGCPQLSVKLIEVATSSSPVRFAEPNRGQKGTAHGRHLSDATYICRRRIRIHRCRGGDAAAATRGAAGAGVVGRRGRRVPLTGGRRPSRRAPPPAPPTPSPRRPPACP